MVNNEQSGSGGFTGYHVEVRIKPSHVITPSHVLGGMVVTHEWMRVQVEEVPYLGTGCDLWKWWPHAKELGLMNFDTAIAIAAQISASSHTAGFLFEFRINQRTVKFSYTEHDTGSAEPFTFDEFLANSKFVLDPPVTSTQGGKGVEG